MQYLKTLILSWTLLILSSFNINAQTTAIPDTLFEAKLISLGIDTDGIINGQILNSDVINIISLNVDSTSISSLAGIEAFINLDTLRCSYNNLTSLNISSNINLRFLQANFNALGSLDLSGMISLKNVICENNNIAFLDLTGCTNLQRLNVNNNNLYSLDVTTLPNLWFLYFKNNMVSHLDLSLSPNLRYLDCSGNRLNNLDLSQNPDLRNIHCEYNRLTKLDCSVKHLLFYLNCEDNQLRRLSIKSTNPNSLLTKNNWAGLQICVDDTLIANANAPWWKKDSSAKFTEVCSNSTLIGHLRHDIDTNCIVDNSNQALPNHILRFSNSSDTFFTKSNTSGFYTGELDTGSYTLELLPNIPYWSVCPSVFQYTTIDSLTHRDTIDWAMQINEECQYMTVDISTPFLSIGDTTNYLVSYCNQGTGQAQNVYIEVNVDTFVNVIGASIPITSQIGTIYRFDLDSVEIGECGLFTISVSVDTSAMLGQTHCTQAHIYPDTLCNNPWNGAILEASSVCQTDTVFFTLKNKGNPMTTISNYSIFEDYVMLSTSPLGGIGAGADTVIKVPAQPGKTYRIEATQESGFPLVLGAPIAHATVVGCNRFANNSFNIGAVPQYYTGNSAPWAHNDCEANRGAYVPNTKQGQQYGYGNQHLITNTTPLDYKIKFQNTSIDTVSNVIIIDTISPYLDPSSIQMKSGSHPYTWKIGIDGVLTVAFENLELLPSTVNEKLSQGYFSYEIHQKPNLTAGTVINSISSIYFDNQAAIITDTVFHTIGDSAFIPLINVSIDYINAYENVKIKVYPNPFHNKTTIELEGKIYDELQVEIVDIAGRVLKTKSVNGGNRINIYRENLIQGIYFYRIKTNLQIIGAGKLVVR